MARPETMGPKIDARLYGFCTARFGQTKRRWRFSLKALIYRQKCW